MKIELTIDEEKKVFTTPFVPMLARRKYLEIMSKVQKKEEGKSLTWEEQADVDDEIMTILVDVVFKNQFTLEQLYGGASQRYIDKKVTEAVFGIKDEDDDLGNEQGK